jgi:hypothetical protein
MELAKSNKEKAMTYMESIETVQKKTKACADFISEARSCKVTADGSAKSCVLPASMVQFFKANKLSRAHENTDNKYNGDQWKYNIESLTNYMNSLGTDTQQKMVYVQDFMGQYNSYLTGASSAIQKSSETLSALTNVR